MKKDKIIQATDLIARALSAIVRINYGATQRDIDIIEAADLLASARKYLIEAQEKQQ